MQRYTIFFIAVNALHVSGGFSAHHNVAFCWLCLKEYIYDARSHERQTDNPVPYLKGLGRRSFLISLVLLFKCFDVFKFVAYLGRGQLLYTTDMLLNSFISFQQLGTARRN